MSRLRYLSSVRGCVSYTNYTKLLYVDFLQSQAIHGYSTYSTIIYAGVSKPWHPKKLPYKSHSAAPVKSMSLSRAQMYLDRHEKWRIQWANPGKRWGKSPSLEVSSWENHPEWWDFPANHVGKARGWCIFPKNWQYAWASKSRNIIWRWFLKKSSDPADNGFWPMFSLLIIQILGLHSHL